MNRKEFISRVDEALGHFLNDFTLFEPDPHLSVTPGSLLVEVVSGTAVDDAIEDFDEVVENAAIEDGAETQEILDSQVQLNPDYYPVSQFLTVKEGEPTVINPEAVGKLADRYCK